MAVTLDLLDNIALFHHQTVSDRLIITAHGEHVPWTSHFKMNFVLPQGKTLHFYTPNHSAMQDLSVAAVARDSQPEYDIGKYVGRRTCSNYKLFYYENDTRHEIEAACREGIGHPDIVVIAEETTLRDVLELLSNRMRRRYDAYEHIHCSFCRVGSQHARWTWGRRVKRNPPDLPGYLMN